MVETEVIGDEILTQLDHGRSEGSSTREMIEPTGETLGEKPTTDVSDKSVVTIQPGDVGVWKLIEKDFSIVIGRAHSQEYAFIGFERLIREGLLIPSTAFIIKILRPDQIPSGRDRNHLFTVEIVIPGQAPT